ncbi:peptide-methionine (S)-S-oxide reductase [Thiobacillus sp. 65-1402]|uniref:peptide-methionine (S)-S-oxide reductase n=1 Tax=Thiobacillus sp. 65-1402 TaxID=1895861 RepID=UPI000A73438B|nr:peptide-methionine (S)-S-oxide reductase [Thiobacillus sp. 65-1402]
MQTCFGPGVIPHRDLLDVFVALHDPAQLKRQGNDVGTQYRSAIFWHPPEQKAEAEAVIAELTRQSSSARPSSPKSPRRRPSTPPRLPPALLRAEPASAVLPVRGCAEGGEGRGEVRGAVQASRSGAGL